MQTKPKVVHRNRLWKYVGAQSDGVLELTETEAQNEPLDQPQDGTLRRSQRKRKPRKILDL